jgi:hypothetical protein
MSVTWDRQVWGGWDECMVITNGTVRLVVTLEVGPRIMSYGFEGGPNLLYVKADDAGLTGGDAWRFYGGHRFWHAPEQFPRTYYPDNHPVEVETAQGMITEIRFRAPVEDENGVQKTVGIALDETGTGVTVSHTLTNVGRWPVELAPWALTVMAPGGRAILPLPPRAPHPEALLPVNTLAMWAYTDLSDPRWTLGERFFLLQQESGDVRPQKIGASLPEGWLACALNDQLFVKRFPFMPGPYPDMGSSAALFTDARILELESMGHMQSVAPGASVTLTERWMLFDDVPPPASDDDVIKHVLPRVESVEVVQ